MRGSRRTFRSGFDVLEDSGPESWEKSMLGGATVKTEGSADVGKER